MKTTATVKTGYVLVTELEKGDTIVNLGIIENIFPHKDIEQTWIKFTPSRALGNRMMMYPDTAKLKVA